MWIVFRFLVPGPASSGVSAGWWVRCQIWVCVCGVRIPLLGNGWLQNSKAYLWADDITSSSPNAIAKTNRFELSPLGGCPCPYRNSLPPLALLFSNLEELAEISAQRKKKNKGTKTGCKWSFNIPNQEINDEMQTRQGGNLNWHQVGRSASIAHKTQMRSCSSQKFFNLCFLWVEVTHFLFLLYHHPF